MSAFDFHARTRVVFGPGSLARLGEFARELGFRRTLLVADEGMSRRSRARFLALGVNGVGVALMIVVFAHTGGLVGAEIGVAGGTAVLAQRVLEAVFGDQAVRRLASTLALSVAVELVILIVLLFGVDVIHGTWWGILGAFVFAELVGWTMRRRYIRPLFELITHGVIATAQAGDRSAVSLEKLKTTRDRVREAPSTPTVECGPIDDDSSSAG